MSNDPELSSSLLADDSASQQSSLRSSAGGRSLLERIQLQREKEAATTAAVPAQHIQVPNYAPVPMEGHGNNNNNGSSSSSSSLFQNAWSQVRNGGGSAAMTREVSGLDDALLAPPTNNEQGEAQYSMGNYFMTFVRDVYGLFMDMHVVLRVVLVALLLFLIYHWY